MKRTVMRSENGSANVRAASACEPTTSSGRRAGLRDRTGALAAALAILGLPAVVLAGDVRGTLTVPSDLAQAPVETEAERDRARYWEEWNGAIEARPARLDVQREIAVVLTGGAASQGEQPPYRLHNGSLSPATIVARVGTAIQIRNEDGVAYELFAEGLSELGPIQTAPGNGRPVTITEAGSWPVRDRVHAHVRGHLHALPDLVARAFVEPSGAYTFRGVAAGTYQLRVFLGARELHSQEVVVPESGQLTVPAIPLTAAPPTTAAAPAAGAADGASPEVQR